jgi:epoxyqueuosine reductase QueG
MEDISQLLLDYVKREGAFAAGIATLETLAGGPPSSDLTYVLPEARSAVSFALALDQEVIESYLAKVNRRAHEKDHLTTTTLASGIAYQLSVFLKQKGIEAVPVCANEVYRTDTENGIADLIPDISLRYLAVASGVGHFGLSGNVITRDYGAAVILGALVTSAELEPTMPLLEKENYCDGCRLCMVSCASGLMSPDELEHVSLGGTGFTYSRRRNYMRCEFVCGGFTGLHGSGKWSTWSPGRFAIPDDDADFKDALVRGLKAFNRWPAMEGGHHNFLMRKPIYYTCGNCSLVCHPDGEIRKKRYRSLTESGVVVQLTDGSLKAMSPESAAEYLAGISPEIKALYGVE